MKDYVVARRRLCAASAAALLVPHDRVATAAPPPLAPRLDAKSLEPLTALSVPSRNGDLRYPQWLEGTWSVTNRISSFSMPLGRAMVDNFVIAVAENDIQEKIKYSYTLRSFQRHHFLRSRIGCGAGSNSMPLRRRTHSWPRRHGARVRVRLQRLLSSWPPAIRGARSARRAWRRRQWQQQRQRQANPSSLLDLNIASTGMRSLPPVRL